MHIKKYILFYFILFQSLATVSQEAERLNASELFELRGSVIENGTYDPIPYAKIYVNDGQYTVTNSFGEFKVNTKIGDELTVKHDGFDTVYHIVNSKEKILIRVDSETKKPSSSEIKTKFSSNIDSAKAYIKINAEKSIQFVSEALEVSRLAKDNALVYETLGDVYFEWRQYDLAITNYKISLQNIDSDIVKLKLAKAFQSNNNYELALSEYESLNKRRLLNVQKVETYEGIGNIQNQVKNYKKAILAYKEGLKIAERYKLNSKVTDLNSKIAKTYNAQGDFNKAGEFFDNALSLAASEGKKRAIEEKITIADFQNRKQAYNEEIELRKEGLEEIKIIEVDSIFDNESALTPQKQNYKIGNAYALQKDFENAIPYLEKSIEEASIREDLIVEKDAYRALAEVQRSSGDVESAIASIDKYESLVDELYIKKEQEIARATRFSKDLINKQVRILGLENERELSESEYQLTQERNKSQKIIIYALIGGLVLFLISGYAMIKYIKQQRITNNLLALKSLRSQMNPHFIFNALNSVNSFIASNDERTANKYLSDFSLLMRAVLENSEESFIPLEKEIALLELYTKLEHSRFKDKFDYAINVGDKVNVQEFQIPPMLLQPYIENAVWHGLRYKKEKGTLDININQSQPDELIITIADDGIGRVQSKKLKTQHQKKQNSKGMENIKKRVAILNKMYKDKVDVNVNDLYENQQDTGTRVVVILKKD